MAAIGVRELKAKAGEVLRRAESGERIVLCRRGRPVATIVAIADAEAAYDGALEAIAGPMIESTVPMPVLVELASTIAPLHPVPLAL